MINSKTRSALDDEWENPTQKKDQTLRTSNARVVTSRRVKSSDVKAREDVKVEEDDEIVEVDAFNDADVIQDRRAVVTGGGRRNMLARTVHLLSLFIVNTQAPSCRLSLSTTPSRNLSSLRHLHLRSADLPLTRATSLPVSIHSRRQSRHRGPLFKRHCAGTTVI